MCRRTYDARVMKVKYLLENITLGPKRSFYSEKFGKKTPLGKEIIGLCYHVTLPFRSMVRRSSLCSRRINSCFTCYIHGISVFITYVLYKNF